MPDRSGTSQSPTSPPVPKPRSVPRDVTSESLAPWASSVVQQQLSKLSNSTWAGGGGVSSSPSHVVVDSTGCLPQNYPGPPKNTSTQKMGYDLRILICGIAFFWGASSVIFISKKVWLCVVTSIAVTYMLPTSGLPKPCKSGRIICSFLWREPHEPILSTVKVFRFRQGSILPTYTKILL